jgi:hypothetical protein
MRLLSKYHQARRDQVTERQLLFLFKFHAPYNNPGNFPVAMGCLPHPVARTNAWRLGTDVRRRFIRVNDAVVTV